MDRRDQDLLDKQMRRFQAPQRRDGVVMLAILSVFFGGMALGGFLFGLDAPTRIALNEPAHALPSAPPSVTR